MTGIMSAFKQHREVSITFFMIIIVGVLIIPISPWMLDFFLSLSLALSALVMMTVLYVKKPLQLSVFPSLLLVLTLFRLTLNVASTRLILGGATTAVPAEKAGKVVMVFGQFVAQNNEVVGLVIFAILVIINFVVITKGSGRIAEVAARFTLDAMPGKQMAIDADLNAGLINEDEARTRRAEIGKEAEFVILDYHATDLMKFKIEACTNLEERLFSLLMLGDDRAVKQTYVMGKPAK